MPGAILEHVFRFPPEVLRDVSPFSHSFEAPWQENIPRKCIGSVSELSHLLS